MTLERLGAKKLSETIDRPRPQHVNGARALAELLAYFGDRSFVEVDFSDDHAITGGQLLDRVVHFLDLLFDHGSPADRGVVSANGLE